MFREDPSAEIAIFNAGSVRIDDVIPSGVLTQYDIIRILPFGGPLVHVEVRGDILARALTAGARNTGVGAFLHASGATVTPDGVLVGGKPIDPDRMYRVVTTDFLLTGRERNLDFFDASAPGFSSRRNLRDVRASLIEELKARFGSR
jgi:5'-nucleotidase